MPYLLLNSRYLVIVLLFLSILGCETSSLREGKDKISEKIEVEPVPEATEELIVNLPPLIYINSLPAFKLSLQRQMQPIFDIGNDLKSASAELDYIESLTGILVTLANYYNPRQFGDQTPQEFFFEIIESLLRWHDAVGEPLGPGTGGTMARLFSAFRVSVEVETMIEKMVYNLHMVSDWEDDFNYDEWSEAWNNSDF